MLGRCQDVVRTLSAGAGQRVSFRLCKVVTGVYRKGQLVSRRWQVV